MDKLGITEEGQASLDKIDQIKGDVDLLDYVFALYDAKWLIMIFFFGFAALNLYRALQIPEMYLAAARVDVRDIRDPGGVKPDSRLTPEFIGILEHGFALDTQKDNYFDVVILRLKSHGFVRHYMDKHNIYKHLNPDFWDEETQSWKDGFVPDKGFDEQNFLRDMLQIGHDPESDILGVRILHRDAKTAAELANLYVADFNDYMRKQTLIKTHKKLDYLYKQLEQTQVIEIQRMLFRLIESQTAAAMLAEARTDYILEVLDPAVRPYFRHSPARKSMTILGGIGGALLAVTLVILTRFTKNILASLDSYKQSHGRKPVSERRWGIRSWLYKLLRLFIRFVKRRQQG